MITYFEATANGLKMNKLWVASLALWISMVTAEHLNNTVKQSSKNKSNCMTRECIMDNLEFELTLLYNMNASVDPCDNFYEFACGNFDNVPDNHAQDGHHYFSYPLNTMYKKIDDLIMKSNPVQSPKLFNFLKNFMTSCKNLNVINHYSRIQEDKLDGLTEVISKLGEWPVVEGPKWNGTNFDWMSFTHKAGNLGADVEYFLYLFLRLGPENARLYLYTPKFDFSYKDLNNLRSNGTIDAYYKYMVDVAKFFGANETQAKIELMESMEFELKLINISDETDTSSNDVIYSPRMSVEEIKDKWPGINWDELPTRPTLTMKTQMNFSNETILIVENHNYITKLEKLMKKTPKRVQANYAIWKTIQSLIPYVESIDLFQLYSTYSSSRNQSHFVTNQECFEILKRLLPGQMFYYYARHYPLEKRVKNYAKQLTLDIKNKFLDILNSTYESDVKTKDKLTAELNSLMFYYGYPDKIFDDEVLDEYYQSLEITPDNLLNNYLNANLFNQKKYVEAFITSKNALDPMSIFGINPFTTDSYNVVGYNTIVIGIERMRKSFFSINRPDHINFATLGVIIGHEMGHSIHGSYGVVNEYGNRNNGWSALAEKKFREAQKCLINQYSNYFDEAIGKKVNGLLYLEENIADNIGLQVTYSVYQDWVKKNGPEPTFSSLSYNSNQLFWLSYANLWCTSKSSLHRVDFTDPHAPVDQRVIGPLSNSPEFSKDFNCPLGSKMNPVKKCSVF